MNTIKKYKPAPESYRYAAETLNINTSEMVMIAAHGWDIAGASHAGLRTAFIERKGQSIYPLAAKPGITGRTLLEVANETIGTFKSE